MYSLHLAAYPDRFEQAFLNYQMIVVVYYTAGQDTDLGDRLSFFNNPRKNTMSGSVPKIGLPSYPRFIP